MLKVFLKRVHRTISSSELKAKETELEHLHRRMDELMHWCGYDSPEIGLAVLYLKRNDEYVDMFRNRLRRGLTFEDFQDALQQRDWRNK